jgi:hypothetical protein
METGKMAKHSSIVGGSNAGRLLNCPASHQAILALPPSADIPSEYAEEGTAMHAVMDALMRVRAQGIAPRELPGIARSWVTNTFHDRALTYAHVDEMIAPALEHLAALEHEYRYGGDFFVVGVEQRVKFPRLAGAFGTIDLVLQNQSCVLHVDWKFGQGVGVRMVYDDGAGATVNSQLMFYIAAAKATKPGWYAGGRRIVGAIIQPRSAEPLTHTEVARVEIRQFVEDVEHAVLAAIGRDPPRVRGEHCRWAPCKVACPHWTGPLLDLAALEPTPRIPVTAAVMKTPTEYGNYLAKAKLLVDSLAMLKAEIDQQMHAYLEAGGTIPGWRLKAKAKQRKWIEEHIVADELARLGFEPDDIWRTELQTFQHVDAAAKKLGVKVPDDLRVAPPTTETTIARSDDPAPVAEPHVAVEQFAAALRQLTAQ